MPSFYKNKSYNKGSYGQLVCLLGNFVVWQITKTIGRKCITGNMSLISHYTEYGFSLIMHVLLPKVWISHLSFLTYIIDTEWDMSGWFNHEDEICQILLRWMITYVSGRKCSLFSLLFLFYKASGETKINYIWSCMGDVTIGKLVNSWALTAILCPAVGNPQCFPLSFFPLSFHCNH